MLDEKELVASKDNNNEWTYRAKANKLHAVKSKLDERITKPLSKGLCDPTDDTIGMSPPAKLSSRVHGCEVKA